MSVMNMSNVSASTECVENHGGIPHEDSGAKRPTPEVEKAGEIDVAREALQQLPALSESRAAEIRKRIRSGYYRQPEVLRQLAERIDEQVRG